MNLRNIGSSLTFADEEKFLKSKTLTVSINCNPKKVYEFVSNLENMPKWAKTFCRSIRESNGEWIIETPQGPMKIKIDQKNYNMQGDVDVRKEKLIARMETQLTQKTTLDNFMA